MKKTILSAIALMGLSVCTYGQSVFFDNTSGGGLVLNLNAGEQINGAIMGGPAGGSLVPVVTLTGGTLLNLGNGLVYDSNGQSYVIPGVAANADAQLQLQFWVGSATSYAAAAANLDKVGQSPIFTNPTGGGGVPPSIPPSALKNMPNVTVAIVPEPSTLALAGLGAAALLMYRSRKN